MFTWRLDWNGSRPRATRPPTMTKARSTAKTRSSRSSSRRIAAHGLRAGVTMSARPTIAQGAGGGGRRARLLPPQERQREERHEAHEGDGDHQPAVVRVVLPGDAEAVFR